MSELVAEPAILQPAEAAWRPSPLDQANIALMNLAIGLGEFLQRENSRDLSELDSRGERAKRATLMLGAKVTTALVITKSGIPQDAIASLIHSGEV